MALDQPFGGCRKLLQAAHPPNRAHMLETMVACKGPSKPGLSLVGRSSNGVSDHVHALCWITAPHQDAHHITMTQAVCATTASVLKGIPQMTTSTGEAAQ